MEFKASMDMKTNIITAAVILLLFSVSNVTALLSGQISLGEYSVLGLPLIALLTCVLGYGFSVRGYTLTPDQLIVKRPFKNAVFLRSDIAETTAFGKETMGFVWRLFGSGGFFGYFGIFSSRQLGRFTMYGTQTQNYVLVSFNNGKKIVLTADAPEELVAAIKNA
jgi:hypothetical protein